MLGIMFTAAYAYALDYPHTDVGTAGTSKISCDDCHYGHNPPYWVTDPLHLDEEEMRDDQTGQQRREERDMKRKEPRKRRPGDLFATAQHVHDRVSDERDDADDVGAHFRGKEGELVPWHLATAGR